MMLDADGAAVGTACNPVSVSKGERVERSRGLLLLLLFWWRRFKEGYKENAVKSCGTRLTAVPRIMSVRHFVLGKCRCCEGR